VRFTIVRSKITAWKQMWWKPPGRAAIRAPGRWRDPAHATLRGRAFLIGWYLRKPLWDRGQIVSFARLIGPERGADRGCLV